MADVGDEALLGVALFFGCLAQTLDLPAVQALRGVLQQPAWADTLATLPGYRASLPGEVLSLTRALPWWQFRTPKRVEVVNVDLDR